METGLPLITSASKKITDEGELPDSFFCLPHLSPLFRIFSQGKKGSSGENRKTDTAETWASERGGDMS